MVNLMPLPIDAVVRVSPNLLSTQVDADLVMMDVRRGVFHGMNPMGLEIMGRITPSIEVGALIDGLCRDYDAPSEQVASETQALLDQMVERGVLEVEGRNAA